MSYFDGPDKGYGWAAGHFLANDEACARETMTIPADHTQAVTRDNGRKVVPAGAVIAGKGIVYEDIDVTEGAKMGSVVTRGTVYGDRLPAPLSENIDGITVIEASPAVTRPYTTNAE